MLLALLTSSYRHALIHSTYFSTICRTHLFLLSHRAKEKRVYTICCEARCMHTLSSFVAKTNKMLRRFSTKKKKKVCLDVKRNTFEGLLTEHINIFYLRRVKSTYFPSKRPNMIFFFFFFSFVAKRFDRIYISRRNVKIYCYSWEWKKCISFCWIVKIDYFHAKWTRKLSWMINNI